MLLIRLTQREWNAVWYWGQSAAGITSADRSARYLVKVLHQYLSNVGGITYLREQLPKTQRHRRKGVSNQAYNAEVKISQMEGSVSVRTLWGWGHDRNCVNISESFRELVRLLMACFPHVDPHQKLDPEQIKKFLRRIEGYDPNIVLLDQDEHPEIDEALGRLDDPRQN